MKALSNSVIMVIILCFGFSIFADTVYLKNGATIEGKIVGQSRKNVRIKTDKGLKVIPKSNIRRLRFGKVIDPNKQKEAELKKKQEAERKRQEAEQKKLDELDKQREAERKRTEKDNQVTEDVRGPVLWQAILRSSILPGWGQYYQGRENMAWIVGGSFGGALAGAAYFDYRYRRDRIAYDDNVDTFLFTSPLVLSSVGLSIPDTSPFLLTGLFQTESTIASRQNMEDSARYADFMTGVLAGVYIWNIVDVIIYHPDENQSLRLKTTPDGFAFRYDLRY